MNEALGMDASEMGSDHLEGDAIPGSRFYIPNAELTMLRAPAGG